MNKPKQEYNLGLRKIKKNGCDYTHWHITVTCAILRKTDIIAAIESSDLLQKQN